MHVNLAIYGLQSYCIPYVMHSMLVGGHLMHTHCVLCVMSAMYAGFSCVEGHVRRVPVTLGSMHAGFHLLPVRVCFISMCCELHACRVPCMLGYKYMLLVKQVIYTNNKEYILIQK